ncbi:MAG: hypothetical protein PHH00_01240 [Candidatus Nanoarchaeia archaeon]|nr:hypothetical protein [Candidatus Nanoarchaeia archaeon]
MAVARQLSREDLRKGIEGAADSFEDMDISAVLYPVEEREIGASIGIQRGNDIVHYYIQVEGKNLVTSCTNRYEEKRRVIIREFNNALLKKLGLSQVIYDERRAA